MAQLHFIGLATAFIVHPASFAFSYFSPLGQPFMLSLLKCTNDQKPNYGSSALLSFEHGLWRFRHFNRGRTNMILAGQLHEWGNESIFWSHGLLDVSPRRHQQIDIISLLIWIFWGKRSPFWYSQKRIHLYHRTKKDLRRVDPRRDWLGDRYISPNPTRLYRPCCGANTFDSPLGNAECKRLKKIRFHFSLLYCRPLFAGNCAERVRF